MTLMTLTGRRKSKQNGRSDVGADMLRTVPFELSTERFGDRILVASGQRTRNRDYWTGKPIRIEPAGMRLDAWRKNNLVLYMHNMGIPLGKASMELEDGMLWASDIEFHRAIIPVAGWELGEFDTGVIADLWESGFLNATSIHVILTPEDEANIVEYDDEIFIPTSEVIEFSIVTIPGDRESVRQELLERGVCEGVAQCLTPTPIRTPGREVTMSVEEEVVEEVVEEEEVIEPETTDETEQAEETQEEVEMILDVTEVAQAIAANPEALRVLARAMASSEEIRAMFAPEPVEATPRELKQRFTLKLVADSGSEFQSPSPEPAPVQRTKPTASKNGKKTTTDLLLGIVQ